MNYVIFHFKRGHPVYVIFSQLKPLLKITKFLKNVEKFENYLKFIIRRHMILSVHQKLRNTQNLKLVLHLSKKYRLKYTSLGMFSN